MTVLLLMLIFLSVVSLWWLLKKISLYIKVRKIPVYHIPKVRKTSIGIRNGTHFFKFVKSISEHANKNDGISLIWSRMKPNFFITDPRDAETILNTCLNKSYTYSFFKPWLGNGLLTAEANMWKIHRRMLAPAFTNSVTSTFQAMFNEKAIKFVQALNDHTSNGPCDVRSHLNEITLEAIYESAIGLPQCNNKAVEKSYTEASQEILKISMKRMFTPIFHIDFLYKYSKLAKQEQNLITLIHKISNDIIRKRKTEYREQEIKLKTMKDNHQRFKPFLQLMLGLSSTGNAFTDQEVREEVDTIIVAGYDTTSITLLNVLVMLGSHPEVQSKVYYEQVKIFKDSKRSVDIEDLQNMIFLEAVIKETLRMYPLGSVVGRDVQRDVKLRNITIPAGSSCYISFWGIHHGPFWGPDCNKFRPERWLESNSLPDLPAAFGGFSFGRRMCVGKNYAMKFIKTVISHVVRNYHIVADDTHLKHSLDVSLRIAEGYHINVSQR